VKRNPVGGLVLDPARESLVSSAGGLLLQQTLRLSQLDRALSVTLAQWRSVRAVHDPGKVLVDLATAVALGGDCAADIAVVRAQPEVFGSVASDPTVSRLVAALAADLDAATMAIRAARAAARDRVWARRRRVVGTPRFRNLYRAALWVEGVGMRVVSSDRGRRGPPHLDGPQTHASLGPPRGRRRLVGGTDRRGTAGRGGSEELHDYPMSRRCSVRVPHIPNPSP
jgi:hypothetical protein